MQRLFVTGTDTNVGKTVVCAWLLLQLDAAYWKPVQAGLDAESDSDTVRRVTGFASERFLPSAYTLREALSPHEAARREGVRIELSLLQPPECRHPLVIEGAGGLLVPLNEHEFMIDLMAMIGAPVILVARSGLGTINHTLLSLQALRRRGLPVAGVVLDGPPVPHNRAAIETYGEVPILAEIPPLDALTRDALAAIRPLVDLNAAVAGEPTP